MSHHLNVRSRNPEPGMAGTMQAFCSCGWVYDSPAYEWPKNGDDVHACVWDLFEKHVKEVNPTAVVCWRLSGWYPNIQYQNRTSKTISDGAIFSRKDLAMGYVAKTQFSICCLERVMLSALDPQIDFFLCDIIEKDRRIEIGRH